MSAVTLVINEESINLDDNSTTHHPITPLSATTLPNDGKTGETDDESANSTVNKQAIEAEDESATYSVSKKEIEADDQCETYTPSKSEIEQILKEQTEESRLQLINIAEDPEMDPGGRSFAETVAVILEWWQAHAEEQNPTSHQIDFSVGSPMSLLMVLALIPEQYQSFIFSSMTTVDRHSATGKTSAGYMNRTWTFLWDSALIPSDNPSVSGKA